MKSYRLAEARATFLSGLVIMALGLLITWGTNEISGGGFVVVTYGLIIVGAIRALIGLFQLMGAAMLRSDASSKPKKWPVRAWVPNPRTVGLLNLNVLGLGYLYQSRWIGWVAHLGITLLMVYLLARTFSYLVTWFVLVVLYALFLIFSAIHSNGVARGEILARPNLPIQDNPRLQKVAIGIIAAQILLLFVWWVLSNNSAIRIGNTATALALKGDCNGAITMTREMTALQRAQLSSDSDWVSIESVCKDILVATNAIKGGNYKKGKEIFASVRDRTIGLQGAKVLRNQAYEGEAEATLLFAEKLYRFNKRSSLIEYLTLVDKFPNSAVRKAADNVIPDLSLEVAVNIASAGGDPTYWYEQLIHHYPDSPQAEEARIALEALK